MVEPTAELRRHPRVRASWRVTVKRPGAKALARESIDVSPYGIKVRMDESLEPGTAARLRLQLSDRRPLHLESVVRRSDTDGPVFVFVNVTGADVERLKALVDSHRGA